MTSGWRSDGVRHLDGGGLMAAAILHSHRNTDVNTAVVLPDARVIAKDVEVLVPAEGVSAMCAPPSVVVVPELQGNSEVEFYAKMYVGDMLNLEACQRGNESIVDSNTCRDIASPKDVWEIEHKSGARFVTKEIYQLGRVSKVLGFDIDTQRKRMKWSERKRKEILQLLLKVSVD